MAPDPLPVVSFGDTHAWDAWLGTHHADSAGVWLKIAKKGSGGQSISYSDALDVALCHGWIDGQKGQARRRLLAPAVHPPQAGQQMVKDQH